MVVYKVFCKNYELRKGELMGALIERIRNILPTVRYPGTHLCLLLGLDSLKITLWHVLESRPCEPIGQS